MRPSSVSSLLLTSGILCALAGCKTAPLTDAERFLPRNGGSEAAYAGATNAELEQLALVAASLVAGLVQLPETLPENLTLQVSSPTSAFGNTVLRALEDAGYGIQLVPADQGSHYVAYRRRVSETDAGPVIDYELSVGPVRLQREFITNEAGVYPSSLLTVEGSAASPEDIVLDDAVFGEQGGTIEAFISGVRDEATGQARIDEIAVNAFDEVPVDQRTTSRELLENARERRTLRMGALAGAAPDNQDRRRRTVLIFDSKDTRVMGPGNKQAVRLLARDTVRGDVFVITACTDADGRDDAARARAARVVEEFLGHGIASEALRIAPCIRASYRHASDDSPVPVEIVQYRRREGAQQQ